jgi:3-oxoadipate enol-lactonase
VARSLCNDVDLAYDDTGGDGPDVVLAHGFLMDRSMFRAQVAALAPRYRVVTFDQRGLGETVAPGPFTFWDSARDLLALLDHLDIERAVVGGMSQGGFVSLRAALTAPERVRALLLLDTQAGTEDPVLATGYDALLDTWLAEGPAAVRDLVAAVILGPGTWDDWFDKWVEADPAQLVLAYRALMDRDDITDHLGDIHCPSLVVHGTEDAAIPLVRAEVLVERLGGPSTLVTVPGGSHAANLTHPAAVNTAVLAFLEALHGSAG